MSLKDNAESNKYCDSKQPINAEESKPRIVLTFRSEKHGFKSSNMKIVSSEEKHDVPLSNHSSKAGYDLEIVNIDTDMKKSKSSQQNFYEIDDAISDHSNTTPKRSARCRNKEYSDNILAKAIARKEEAYNLVLEYHTPTPRLSRRIKPTAKKLANKELDIGSETQNSSRLGITTTSDRSPEEGVQTRRSARRRSIEPQVSDDSVCMLNTSGISPKKRKLLTKTKDDVAEKTEINDDTFTAEQRSSSLKKKHLSNLGLKAISGEEEINSNGERNKTSTSNLSENANDSERELQDLEEEELREEEEQSDVIEEQSEEDISDHSSDEDFTLLSKIKESVTGRSSKKKHSDTKNHNEEDSSDEQKEAPRRRSRRLRRPYVDMSMSPYGSEHSEVETEEINEPPEGDEAMEATCPDDDDEIVGECMCEAPGKLFATPEELEEPVFCRAVEWCEGTLVGCSREAAREHGAPGPLLRAGPRCPFLLLCTQHAAMMRRHLCCAGCGLFCTMGVFYQCSKGHLFHGECGPGGGLGARPPGCAHCGVRGSRQPVSRDVARVRVSMRTANKRILLPEQRLHCTPAYLGFSKLDSTQFDQGPLVPEDLLPSIPIDLKTLKDTLKAAETEQTVDPKAAWKSLKEAIVNGVNTEQLIQKMVGVNVNEVCEGSTCAHLAARTGNLAALYLLQYCGADLDAVDAALHTPLMLAVLALLDKTSTKSKERYIKTPAYDDATSKLEGDEPNRDTKIETKSEKQSDDTDPIEKSLDTNKAESPEIEPVSEADKNDTDDVGMKLETDPELNEVVKPILEKQASDEGLMKVIRYLVAAGCDVNLAGPEGMTALHMAARLGGDAVCAAILEAAAVKVNARDQGGWTPLVWAAENNHPTVVRRLLGAGAESAACDAEGNTALHWCALRGAAAVLPLLLPAVDTAPRNANGDTPLHIAARQGHYSCVIILLAHGVPTDIANVAGELPVEVATGECRTAIELNTQLAGAVRRSLVLRDISKGRERWPIPCINEVDDAEAPDFIYVTAHVMPTNLTIDRSIDTLQGCACTDEECSDAGCACSVLGVRRWAVRGRLPPTFPYDEPPLLFECNQTCRCDLKRCDNTTLTRVLRYGATFVRTQVFRVGGARGWALRAAERVQRGVPVALYCGELLPENEADARTIDDYMFELALKADLLEQCIDKTQLCVDAARYGSAARFINHSCRPNLAPVRVLTDGRDLRLPHVALFATRDIAPFEELTFDYGDKFWSVKSQWMKCECGAPTCRYPATATEDECP